MSELQAVIECQVELFKFFNIDLFQRGYYQVRTSLKTSPKTTAKIDVTLTRTHGSRLKAAYVLNGSVAVSKTFQILYRKEDVELYDVFTFKIYMLVDINKIEQYMQDADFQLIAELWFTEEDVRPETILQCVSTRSVRLHIRSEKGVHHYLPLQFDYFHLSAVALNIHATLLGLHPSYISLSGGSSTSGSTSNVGNSRASSLSAVNRTDPTSLPGEFSSRPASATQSKSSSRRVQQAFDRHRRMCRVLLCVYESLQSSFETLIAQLPKNKQIALEHVDCQARFDEMIAKSHRYALIDEEDMVQATQSDIATLCGQNFLLWMQYLELVTFSKKMTIHLAREHHTQRVKRFAEAFFVNEFRKQEMIACFDASVHGHVDIVNQVRSSSYYQSIPALAAECSELDGDAGSLPIVFEDIYTEQPAAILMTDTASEKPPASNKVELRRPAAVAAVVNNNPRPESGFSILGGRTSRLNRDSVSSIASSDSSSASRKSGVTLRRGKTESFCRPTAQVRAQVATDSTDCALVGYRKIDTSGTLNRPVVELGTLTTPQPMDEMAALAGTGVVMQPSLLFNAISMPTLCSAGVTNREPDSSFRGSMPTLNSSAELDTSTVEIGLQPYWRGQQQKAQLLAQHSTGGSETVAPPECGSGTIEDGKDSSTSVSDSKDGSTPESERGSADDLDKNTTLTDENVLGNVDDRKNEHSVSICDVTIVECEAPVVDVCTDSSSVKNLVRDQTVSSGSTELEAGKTTEPVVENNVLEATGSGDVTAKDGCNAILKSDPEMKAEPSDNELTALSNRKPDESNASNNITECNVEPPSAEVTDKDALDELNVAIPREDSVCTQSDDMVRSSDKCTLMELIREENRRERDEAAAVATVMTGIYDDSIAARLSGANEHSRPRHDGTSGRLDGVDEMDGFVETDESSGGAEDAASKNCTIVERPSTSSSAKRLVPVVDDSTILFIGAKETLRKQLGYTGHFYSDFPSQFSVWPYFWPVEIPHPDDGIHLVVCVHGLDGNSTDLRLVRTYLELALPGGRLDFLMSERNQTDTFADFEVMTDRLVNEIMYHIDLYGIKPTRISFIGHSLGNLIIRSAMSRPQMAELLPKLHTFLSLSGPHLGTLFNNSGLVNMGMWLMQKWKKSGSLLQLSLKDHPDPRQTFLYKLSQKTGLEFFRNILLVGSQQDRYVPYHSSRIELCKAAMRDSSGLGAVYVEMVNNILQPIIYKTDINFIRYDIYHALPSSTTNNLIGRAAHIAVLDSEIFIEKFVSVAVLKYFI